MYNISFCQNTTYGDYGNATGPDGTFTGLLLQTGESNAGLPKVAGYKMDVDTEKLTQSYRYSYCYRFYVHQTDSDNGVQDHKWFINKTTKVWTVTLNLSLMN
jgi:hypothetical protein